jgi:hypothetical protein
VGLVKLSDERLVVLLAEHVFGRSQRCQTLIDDPGVSSHHAMLSWRDGKWWVRDLGSTNGTSVNAAAIPSGTPVALTRGDTIRLKDAALELTDDAAPTPAVLCLATGALQPGDASLVLIPNDVDPIASVHLAKGASWWLDIDGHSTELDDGQVFECAGKSYRFFSGGRFAPTAKHATDALRLCDLELEFRVSLDEEHVALRGHRAGKIVDLGARACNYLLLTLARQRQHDARDATLPETSHGWIDSLDLLRMLGCNETKLSVDVCRVRQVFSKAGFEDAADVIERRRGTRQLRLGIAQCSIVQV